VEPEGTISGHRHHGVARLRGRYADGERKCGAYRSGDTVDDAIAAPD
jgi:hypothetical protein